MIIFILAEYDLRRNNSSLTGVLSPLNISRFICNMFYFENVLSGSFEQKTYVNLLLSYNFLYISFHEVIFS